MVEIASWMEGFVRALDACFGARVQFIGLQGSYARGEAAEHSDIDVVVIFDELTARDVRAYGAMLDTLPERERICGFISGKRELLNWEPSDLFQFYHDTKPIRGSLDVLLPVIDAEAAARAVKIGACNLYHACLHNMLHKKSEKSLRGHYKTAAFLIQAIVFLQTGRYVSGYEGLMEAAQPEERGILKTCMHLKAGGTADFDAMSEKLFEWIGKQI